MSKLYEHKIYVLNSSCFFCESNEFDFYFPNNNVKAHCRKCGKERDLTHTEVNTYCGDWA